MEEKSLAYELLEEVKRTNDRLERSNKRWYYIAIIELLIIVAIVIGHFVYESQYDYTSESYQSIEGNENSMNFNQSIGD